MRDVLGTFGYLWPSQNRRALEALIGSVKFLVYPDESNKLESIRDPNQYVIIMSKSQVHDIMRVVAMGFEHIVQRDRPDFAQELLTSCLMIARPKAFLHNPIPFVLTKQYPPESAVEETMEKSELVLKITSSSSKAFALTELDDFLKKAPRNHAIIDLCIQAADELISNTVYNAPVNENGEHIYEKVSRDEVVEVPAEKAAKLFCSYSDYRVMLGCLDQYGSFQKRSIKEHLVKILSPEKVKPRNSFSAGAGVGMRFISENAANFYLYCEQGKRSLVGCGFVTGGMRANLSEQKHFHISFH